MTTMDDYRTFIEGKIAFDSRQGFDVADADIHPILKPHQRDIVRWACAGGRRAIFAAFGLGKSVMQLEILRLTLAHLGVGSRALIICPLGVRQEFVRDAAMLGLSVTFVRHDREITGAGLYLTNYESVRDGRLDPNQFEAVSLDEASVLRSFGSKTYQTFLSLFDLVQHRYVATATPSPNRYKELIHYAGFLGVMDTGQALTRFFQRDSTQANNLTLYPHKEREFWLWLNTWAVFLQRPSDLGYDDDTGYSLPELDVRFHEVQVDHSDAPPERDGQHVLLRDAAMGVTAAAGEKRATLDVRVAKAAELVNGSDDHFIVWHDLEDERRAINAAIPDAVDVFGAQDLELREQRVIDFSDGKFRVLATKPQLSGSGCNFQRHCHRAVFVGVGFKFNDFIQAVHRIHRFLQTEQVRIDIIHAESEREIVATLMHKWRQHQQLTERMSDVLREFGLDESAIQDALARSIGVDRVEASGPDWLVANNDCVAETSEHMDDDSVGLVVTSIPFSNHYEYTPAYEDFGHTDDNDHFWSQMDHLTPQLLRVLQPGRIYACHVKDRILFGNATGKGVPTVSPFHAEAIMHTTGHGFDYLGMITVVTDVVRENNQTYRLGWTEQCKDGSKMGVGSPEYILLFRKPQTDRTKGYADVPVVKDKGQYSRARWQMDADAFWRSGGNRLMRPDEWAALPMDEIARLFTQRSLAQTYDHEQTVALGEALDADGRLPSTFKALALASHHPDVWHDVNRMLTLNTEQSRRAQAMHVCPLQFDIVDRLIGRYSNPGDLVFDPFGGLFTVPLRAVKAGRRGRGVELNAGYFADGVDYLRRQDAEASVPSLFDALADGGVA